MKKFFSKQMDELTVMDTLVYSFVVSTVCFAPFGIYAIGCVIADKITEIKSRKEDEEE